MNSLNNEKIKKGKGFRYISGSASESERRKKSRLKRTRRESKTEGKKYAEEAYQEFLEQDDRSIEKLIDIMDKRYQQLITGAQKEKHQKGIMVTVMRERIDAFKARCMFIVENFGQNQM